MVGLRVIPELMLALLVLPTVCGAGALACASPFLDRCHLRRLQGQDSSRNWLYQGLPGILPLLLAWAVLGAAAIGIATARRDLGVYPAVALVVAAVLAAMPFTVGAKSVHRDAQKTWARGAELTNLDLIFGVQQVVRRTRWRFAAMTCAVNGGVAELVFLAIQGPRLDRLIGTGVLMCVGGALAWLGLRFVDIANPAGEFLEKLSLALWAGMEPRAFTDLNGYRERQWGAGGASLIRSLPALQRSLNSMLRRYPALPEEPIRSAATPLFDDLLHLAVSGRPISPSEATKRAVRLALRDELPARAYVEAGIRPLSDLQGWNRPPSMLPGEIGRWLPDSAARVGRNVAAVIAVAGVLAGIIASWLG